MTDHPNRPTAMTARIPRTSHIPPRRTVTVLAAALGLVLAACGALPSTASAEAARTLPEFPHQSEALWLNSPPLGAADLQGRVVLLDLFTEG